MLIEELSGYLAANGHPSAGLGALPSTPDDAFALWEYGGQPPLHVKQSQSIIMEYPRFQLITRSKSYPTARLKAEYIYRLLTGFRGELSGVGYCRIHAMQSPYFMDRDDVARARFVCNFEAYKAPSPI